MYRSIKELKEYLHHYANRRRPFKNVWQILSSDFDPKEIQEHKDKIEQAYILLVSLNEIRATKYGSM